MVIIIIIISIITITLTRWKHLYLKEVSTANTTTLLKKPVSSLRFPKTLLSRSVAIDWEARPASVEVL